MLRRCCCDMPVPVAVARGGDAVLWGLYECGCGDGMASYIMRVWWVCWWYGGKVEQERGWRGGEVHVCGREWWCGVVM